MRRWTIGVSVVAVTVLGVVAIGAGRASAKGGAEHVPISCSSEWNPDTGTTALYVFAPDTPLIPVGPSGFLPFTGATGTGVFTPSGRMNIVCGREGDGPFSFPAGLTWHHAVGCTLYRGGADFSTIGARVYKGTGRVDVTTDSVQMTCHGSFTGISTGPES
ncbi:MAG TPA: hypothetical protein VGI77_08515 [Gaiellaceae bacterium]|jgi:hypothetical protein